MADDPVIFQKKKKRCQASPIPKAVNNFTGESSNGKASIVTKTQTKSVICPRNLSPKASTDCRRSGLCYVPQRRVYHLL